MDKVTAELLRQQMAEEKRALRLAEAVIGKPVKILAASRDRILAQDDRLLFLITPAGVKVYPRGGPPK